MKDIHETTDREIMLEAIGRLKRQNRGLRMALERLVMATGRVELDLAVLEKMAQENIIPVEIDITREEKPDERIEVGHLVVSTLEHKVLWKGHDCGGMSNLIFRVLCVLARRPNRVYSTEELFDKCWPMNTDLDDPRGAVASQVKRLRKVLKRVDPDFAQIRTVYSNGYSWIGD